MFGVFKNKTTSRNHDAISVIPIPGTVLIPTMMLPLFIDDKKNKLLVDHALENKSMIGIYHEPIALKNTKDLEGKIIGVGTPKLLQKFSDEKKNIILIGQERFLIKKVVQEVPYIKVEGERLVYPALDAALEMSLLAEIKILGLEWIKREYPTRTNVAQYLVNLNNLDDFINFVASYLFEDFTSKQLMLDYESPIQKFTFVYEKLVSKLDIKKKSTANNNVIQFRRSLDPREQP